MPIADRNLSGGTRLVGRYKGATYRAEVVQTDESLRYRLEDGREFKSPSSAASAVMGGKAVNGWRLWSVADEATDAPSQTAKPGAGRPKKSASKPATEQSAPSG
jgi:hypothetical protein